MCDKNNTKMSRRAKEIEALRLLTDLVWGGFRGFGFSEDDVSDEQWAELMEVVG